MRKTLDEKIKETDLEIEKLKKKLDQKIQNQKSLEAKSTEQKRKERTHRLIQIGAAVESVVKKELTEEEIKKLIFFLQDQEERGGFLTKALKDDAKSQSDISKDMIDWLKSDN